MRSQWVFHIVILRRTVRRVHSSLVARAPQKLKETAYCCLVRPTLEDACVLWDPHQKYLADKLEKLQNRAARFVTGNYSRNNSVTETKNVLGWETLLSRRKDFRLRYLLAIFNDMTGIDKSNYIKLPNYISNRVNHTRKTREISCRTD
uniref:Putative endonuclease/reverse transcriptase n=1 Tax=Ixodes ricinus TaxID=34613 RepID=A0A090XCI7_IXORI